MHYGAGVVLSSEVVDPVLAVLVEGGLFIRNDVVPVDGDVFVPVRPALFVEEAQGVHELVDDNPGVDAASAETDLLPRASPSDAAAAALSGRDVDVTSL